MFKIFTKNTCIKYGLSDDWNINKFGQSFELSILDILEDKIVMQCANKYEYIRTLKNKMVNDLLDGNLHKKFDYMRKKDYNKTKMCIDIMSDAKIKKDSTIKYYSDYFNINIIIFDYDRKNISMSYATVTTHEDKKKYEIDIYKPFIFLAKYKNKYSPFTRTDGDNMYFYSENNDGVGKLLIDKFVGIKNKKFTKLVVSW